MNTNGWRNASWAILMAFLVVTPLACGGGTKTPSNTGGSGGDTGGTGGSSAGGGGGDSTGGAPGGDDASMDDAAPKVPKALGGTCKTSTSCETGLMCDTTKRFCTKTCASDTDCADMMGVCITGECYKSCMTTLDCKKAGWICSGDVAKMYCDVDPNAPDGGSSGGDGGGSKGDGGGSKGDGAKKSD